MKLSFNTFTYSSFPNWLPAYPIDYVIKSLSSIGYDALELGCASPVAYPPYMTKKDRENIYKLLKENNIAVSSVLPTPGGACGNNVSSPIEAERKQAVQSYKDSIDLAYDLDSHICLYVAGWVIWGVDQDQAWQWSKDCLTEIAKYAKAKNVMIAIEPTPSDSNLIETPDDALKLMTDTNLDNVKVMFDTIHILYRKEIMTDYVEKMGNNLIHIHLSDIDRTPPGTCTDFKSMIDALKKIDYKGYLTMEIALNGRGVDPNLNAKKAYDYMKSIM